MTGASSSQFPPGLSAHVVPVPGAATALLMNVPPVVSAGTVTLITNVTLPLPARLTATLLMVLPLPLLGLQLEPGVGLAQVHVLATSGLGTWSLNVAWAGLTVDWLRTTTV